MLLQDGQIIKKVQNIDSGFASEQRKRSVTVTPEGTHRVSIFFAKKHDLMFWRI